jgi:hypothetical protein
MPSLTTLLTLNLVSSSGIFILIWLTQILIYPSFLLVDASNFKSYHNLHTSRMTWIVAPLMLLDGVVSLLVFMGTESPLAKLNALLCVAPLAATFVYYGPLHDRIARKYEVAKLNALTQHNWLRVALWSAKLVVAYSLTKGTL